MRKAVLALGLVIGVGAAAGLFFLQKNQVLLDSAEVEQRAAAMLPGAKPPSGLRGVLGLHPEGLEVVIFAPALPQASAENLSGSDLRILIARPTSPHPPSPQEISDKIDQAQKKKAQQMDTLEKKPILLSVGGKPYPGLESRLSLKSNGAKLRENLTILMPDQKPVVVLIVGPENSFNTSTRDEFLSALQAPQGTPHPDLPKLPHGHPTVPRPAHPMPPGPRGPARLPGVHRPARPSHPRPPAPGF
jgi:hypothetical protein